MCVCMCVLWSGVHAPLESNTDTDRSIQPQKALHVHKYYATEVYNHINCRQTQTTCSVFQRGEVPYMLWQSRSSKPCVTGSVCGEGRRGAWGDWSQEGHLLLCRGCIKGPCELQIKKAAVRFKRCYLSVIHQKCRGHLYAISEWNACWVFLVIDTSASVNNYFVPLPALTSHGISCLIGLQNPSCLKRNNSQ